MKKKKEMIPLTDEEDKYYKKTKISLHMQSKISTDDNNKTYHKFRGHCLYTGKFRGASHTVWNLR